MISEDQRLNYLIWCDDVPEEKLSKVLQGVCLCYNLLSNTNFIYQRLDLGVTSWGRIRNCIIWLFYRIYYFTSLYLSYIVVYILRGTRCSIKKLTMCLKGNYSSKTTIKEKETYFEEEMRLKVSCAVNLECGTEINIFLFDI